MEVHFWITLLLLFISESEANVKCRISRIHTMKAADCYDKDLRIFTQALPSDVEIIDSSHNRIRKIAAKDLEKYSQLKILYLNDNVIVTVDEEAFSSKTYLETLDLSLNAIMKLPPVLFHLPSLKSLYLGQNVNMNIIDAVEKAIPITSPLYNLDINNIMSEDYNELPRFGVLSVLEKYNISGNKVLNINVNNFAGLCSLKILDTTNVTLLFDDERLHCDCWSVNKWLKSRNVIFKEFDCDVDQSDCEYKNLSYDDEALFTTCKKTVKVNAEKAKMKSILLITIPSLLGVMLIISIIWFYMRRRRRRLIHQEEPVKEREENIPFNYEINSK